MNNMIFGLFLKAFLEVAFNLGLVLANYQGQNILGTLMSLEL